MNEFLSAIVLNLLCCAALTGSTIVVDFETPSTSATYQYFGSSLDGSLVAVISNPDISGINTSTTVGQYVKPTNAQSWAGAFSNPDTEVTIDLTTNSKICIKVWFNAPGNLAFKTENSTTGGSNWLQTQPVTIIQQWTEVCYDVASPSEEHPMESANGQIYQRSVLFFDYGSTVPGAEDVIYYFDDITLSN